MGQGAVLAAYVPRLVEDHLRRGDTDRLLFATGTLVSADISGFTALSERLAELGKEGAEQLTDLLNRVFAEMIAACEVRDGDIVKFGGDALLVLFTGEQHARDAAIAMSQMHAIVGGDWSTDSAKRVSLGISQGAHSGTIGFSITDAGHLELLVGGPAVTATVDCEGDAGRGEILVSVATAELLPDDWLGDAKDGGARSLLHRRVRRAVANEVPQLDLPPRGIPGLDRYLPDALAEQVVAGVPGEHRQVVIAFVNMSGTDELFERSGAMAVHEACEQLGANVAEVLRHHPIHLLASDAYVNGTKLILTAGAPLSTDADEDHMLLALHDLFAMEAPLPIKAGVNRGHVYVGDLGGPTRRTLTVMGDAVNLAARLMQASQPGQIVVGEAVLDRAETDFDVVELEPFTVKGKSKPVRASVLGEPIGHAGEPADEHLGHVGFVGREAELVRLDALARAALAGRGSVVEVVGEPGIGKSRLLRETLHHHQEFQLHRMRGGQYARNTPFFAVRRLLHELLDLAGDDHVSLGEQLAAWARARAPALQPWLPLLAIPVGAEVPDTPEVTLLAEQFRRDRLITVAADAIDAAVDRPVAILTEDIHLFDTGSLDVLLAVGARARERPWFIVATHRSEPGLMGADSEPVVLEPLALDEVIALAEAAGARAGIGRSHAAEYRLRELADRAGGNPLFLLELVAASGESGDALPENVESLVTTRIDVLPARDRTLLREAAVAGTVVEADLVASAFGRPDLRHAERWERLDTFLVSDRPGAYRFRQSLYRDVAYGGLSYRRRREAHLAIGLTLESREAGSAADVASLLSDHFERGHDRKRAWKYSVIGGDGARSAYANREAISLYERALRNATGGTFADPLERARVAEALGDVQELSGQYAQAVEAYRRSRSVASGSPVLDAKLLRKIGGVRLREGRFSQALRWFTRAGRIAEHIVEPAARTLEQAEIALIRAGALHRQGRDRESVRWANIAAGAAETAGDRLVRARAYNMLEICLRTLGRPEASVYSDLALEMYTGSGDLVGEANVLNNRGVRAYFAGDWRGAIVSYERSRTLRMQSGDVVGEAMVTNNIGEILCLQGRFDAARELFEQARSSWEASTYSVGVAYATANLAMMAARSGDAGVGADLLDRAVTMVDEMGASGLLLEMAQRRVECALLAGDTDDALAEATALQARLANNSDSEMLNQVGLLLGIAELRTGHLEQAAATLLEALRTAVADTDRYVEAMCLLSLAELDEARGVDATASQRHAAELLRQLGVEVPPPVTSVRLSRSSHARDRRPGVGTRPTTR